jgi:glycosyltransferase involved in cell wall biosynthesis
MITNTFTPHVGGVARSVQRFTDEYRKLGHSVCVVAPGVPGKKYSGDVNTIRIPAAEDVLGSSFYLPVLTNSMEANIRIVSAMFYPDVIHSHHPFLLGTLARRISDFFKKPLVFTHHTMYEQYSHVLHKSASLAPEMLKNVATEYANVCDCVIAPSASTMEIIRSRGVRTPIQVLPTGVDVARFATGLKSAWRSRLGIPENAPVLGHVGRLAPEKNLDFLANAVKLVLKKFKEVHFVVVGDGTAKVNMESRLRRIPQVHFTGSLSGQPLIDAYHAMDAFVFSSFSETQGMVLTEAMAAGLPVVAIDAPGVADVLQNDVNGYMIPKQDAALFANAAVAALRNKERLTRGAKATAKEFSQEACARKAIALYEGVSYKHKPNLIKAASFTHSLLKTFLR